jgi:hypothetical protein
LIFSCTNAWDGHPNILYIHPSRTPITDVDSIEVMLVITVRLVEACRETKSDQKSWSHYVVETLRRSLPISRKIMTKGNVFALCAWDDHDHDRTIAKSKIYESDLSDLAPKAFN